METCAYRAKILKRVLALLLVFLITGCGKTAVNQTKIGQKWAGRLAPDFEVTRINGEKFQLSDHVGKRMIVLNFLGSWCAPCRAELPALYDVYADAREDVLLFGIALNREEKAVKQFFRQLNVSFPAALERRNGRNVADLYEMPTVPTTVVIGVKGTVQMYKPGMLRKWDYRALNRLVEKNRKLRRADKAISKEGYLRRVRDQEL